VYCRDAAKRAGVSARATARMDFASTGPGPERGSVSGQFGGWSNDRASHRATLRGAWIGCGTVRETASRQAARTGCEAKSADRSNGLLGATGGPSTLDGAANRCRGSTAETGSSGRPGDDPHPSTESRSEAVAGKKCSVWRN